MRAPHLISRHQPSINPYFKFKPIRLFSKFTINRERKLMLLAMDWKRQKDPPVSLAQASILANLKRHQINVINKTWSVNDVNFKMEDVYNFVNSNIDENTDIALGAYVWHEHYTQKLLRTLRHNNFSGRIILGGPQISYVKNNIEKYYPEADIFIRGYAEEALAQLFLSDKTNPSITGVHYAGEFDSGLSATADLENLPSPFLDGLIPPQPFIRWETQRGCPFRCTFCQHRESDISMKRRQLSYSRIMQELEWIITNPIIQDIAVLDPTFNSGPHYMPILQKLTEGNYTGKIALQCRMEMIKDEFLEQIEILNQKAHVVLEFGLQTIHPNEAKIIQRPNNMKKVEHVLNETKKSNIATEVSLIFGLPQQTLQSFQASVQFCKNHLVPTIYAYPLMLLRGTPLYEKKNELGLVESTDIELKIDRALKDIPHVISSPSFTYDDWSEMAKIAESLDVYNSTFAYNKKTGSTKMSETLRHTLWQGKENINDVNKNQISNTTRRPITSRSLIKA
jgi:radical SAM superfamily enzyme YgiQ (UPF0313 family)